ncbi:hypothetical protein SOM70_37330 [Streptomyces salinarius]|uniref:hypothetical protein n=1 Tax=Streptomyces salinarius TaxID=2762598 RepID=UPI0032DE629C
MGTLGLAAVLAVALAALRGTAGAITDWRQRRMEAAAEAAPLRAARLKLQEAQMKADAASTGGGGRVPSSNEYGRRSLARTGSGGGGSGGGSRGGGSSSGGRTGPGRSLASSGGTGSRTGSPSGSGGTGPGRKGSGSNSGGSGSSTRSTGTGKGPSSGSGSGSGGKAGGSGKGSSSGSNSGRGSGSSDSSGGSGSGGGRRPGVLGQLALDRSKRRTSREAAGHKQAARQQKADLAERKRAGKDGGDRDTEATGKGGGKSAGTDRVTLGKALGDEARSRAEERLRRRRENPDPPFLRRVPRDGAETAEGAATTSTEGDTTGTGKSGPETPAGGATTSAPGSTAGTAPGGPGTATGGPTTTGPGTGTSTGPDGATSGPGSGWEYWEPPGGGGRRNPWDSLFEAKWDARVVWTVEQVDPPGAHAKRWEPEAIAPARAGLPAGPSPTATAAAGTTTPTTTKETRVSAPLIPTPRAGGAASEHLTDVTLDDVLNSLEKSKTDCFATYDECADLADKALKLRDSLHELADELAERHNVIGRLTSAAMHRLGESMDLLARRAEAMRTESLHAAESVELAHDEMHDAYKPVQQATADAGLVMPSARIHNED